MHLKLKRQPLGKATTNYQTGPGKVHVSRSTLSTFHPIESKDLLAGHERQKF
jgi:hypothetical protein